MENAQGLIESASICTLCGLLLKVLFSCEYCKPEETYNDFYSSGRAISWKRRTKSSSLNVGLATGNPFPHEAQPGSLQAVGIFFYLEDHLESGKTMGNSTGSNAGGLGNSRYTKSGLLESGEKIENYPDLEPHASCLPLKDDELPTCQNQYVYLNLFLSEGW